MQRHRWPSLVLLVVAALVAACGTEPVAPDAGAPSSLDGSSPDASDTTDGGGCGTVPACDDGLFCNGPERCESGACRPGTAPCTSACDESSDRCVTGCDTDADGDGARATECGGDDCDDADAARHPGAPEVCDAAGTDEDCDPTTLGDRDRDGDGANDAACCNGATCGADCDDLRSGVSPTSPEVCDGGDNDCDRAIDEGLPTQTYLADCDGDMYARAGAESFVWCATPVTLPSTCLGAPAAAWATAMGDCDDARPGRNPAVAEVCNGVDDNCDGMVDEMLTLAAYVPDCDGDGHGAIGAAPMTACLRPALPPATCGGSPLAGWADLADDCNDRVAAIHPRADEVCDDSIDEDCDGRIDEGPYPLYPDGDRDGYGMSGASILYSCVSTRSGYATASGDCDDATASINPGQPERCNGIDDDCSGVVDDPSATATLCGSAAGTSFACTSARCSVASCSGTYADCDGSVANGCEADLATSSTNCGRCGYACGAGSYCVASTCRPTVTWSRSIGGTAEDQIEGAAMDASGNTYVVGTFQSSATFGAATSSTAAGSADLFVASYDTSGTLRWLRTIGAAGRRTTGADVAIDASGNVYVAGLVDQGSAPVGTISVGGSTQTLAGSLDLIIASYTSAGTARWGQLYGSTGADYGVSLAANPSGQVVLAATMAGRVNFGGGTIGPATGSYLALVGLDASGVHRFSRAIAPLNNLVTQGVTVDPMGRFAITGILRGTVDFGGGSVAPSGSFYDDLFVAAFDGGGTHVWSRAFGASGANDSGRVISNDGVGTLYVAGTLAGSFDFGGGPLTVTDTTYGDAFLAALDFATGAHRWSRSFTGADTEMPDSIVADASGVAIGGMLGATTDFGGGTIRGGPSGNFRGGPYLALFTSTGAHRFSRAFAGDGTVKGLAFGAAGLVFGGSFGMQLDVGRGPLTTYDVGTFDGFLGLLLL